MIIPYFIFSITIIFPQEGTIGLKNKKVDSESDKIGDNNTPDKLVRREPILPNSIYIGELGDYNDVNKKRIAILKSADLFFTDLQKGRVNNYISDNFKFIFNTVYFDSLLGEDNELIRWNIGHPEIYDDRANAELELYYRERIYVGNIYFEKIESWKINDLQLDIIEKKFFDPSSPY